MYLKIKYIRQHCSTYGMQLIPLCYSTSNRFSIFRSWLKYVYCQKLCLCEKAWSKHSAIMENLYYVKYLFYLMRSNRSAPSYIMFANRKYIKVLAFYCTKFSNRKLLVCVYTYTKNARRHERCIGAIMITVSTLACIIACCFTAFT